MRTIALRHLAEINPPSPEFDALPADANVLFLPLEAVWSDGRADQTRRSPKDLVASGYTRFQAGDTVCPKVTPTFQAGRSMRAMSVGAGTTELHVLRPRPGVDPRWITYAVRSKHFLEEGVAAFQGVAGLQRVPPEFVADFRVVDASVDEQRRIAEFLDDRVSRIDQIINARRQEVWRLNGLAEVGFAQALRFHGLNPADSVELGWRSMPVGWRQAILGRVLLQLTNGFVGPTRDILVEEGVPYIQGTHIKNGRIDFDRRPFFVSQDWHRARPRINLRAGDVIIVQTGDIGQTAIVPENFGPASCHALLIARANPLLITAPFLVEHLRSDFGQASMLARATGALHPHLEAGIRTCPIALPPLEVQADVVDRVGAIRGSIEASKTALITSIDLLQEYEQSLITAAVTGELDVTTAGRTAPQ